MFVASPTPSMPSAPPLSNAGTGNGAILANQGLRRVSHLLKALSNTSDENSHHRNYFGSENMTQDKLWQKFGTRMQHLRITEQQLEQVITDTEQFRKIQQALRDRCGQTDALAKQIAPTLIRERLEELRREEQTMMAELEREQLAMREEQRKLSIQRELAEARIKARQALNISVESNNKEESSSSDLSSHTEGDDQDFSHGSIDPASPNMKASSNENKESPTSVTSTLTLSEEQFLAFKPGLVVEEDSSDGDIQEVEEE